MWFSSQRSRDKIVRRLMAAGVDERAAHRIAWASFPFDDSARPTDRGFEKAVRSESFTYVRRRNASGDMGDALATETLARWASLASAANEHFYGLVYGRLSDGFLLSETPTNPVVEEVLAGRSSGEGARTTRGELIEGGAPFDMERMGRHPPLYTPFHYECTHGHRMPDIFVHELQVNSGIHYGVCDQGCSENMNDLRWAYSVWDPADVPEGAIPRDGIPPPSIFD